MVEQQLRKRGISDSRVLAAMGKVPRELFVPPEYEAHAYDDDPLPIGLAQTISQPYMVALMAQCLHLNGDEQVLEVGCGSGYAAAVLSLLAGEVISLEHLPELAEHATAALSTTGYSRKVEVLCLDGSLGYPLKAPYPAISVAAGAPHVPPALLEQLAEGGRLVIPVGSHEDQDLLVASRLHGKIEYRTATHCRFVPLTGAQGWN